jgi:hypothetical protein
MAQCIPFPRTTLHTHCPIPGTWRKRSTMPPPLQHTAPPRATDGTEPFRNAALIRPSSSAPPESPSRVSELRACPRIPRRDRGSTLRRHPPTGSKLTVQALLSESESSLFPLGLFLRGKSFNCAPIRPALMHLCYPLGTAMVSCPWPWCVLNDPQSGMFQQPYPRL